MRSNFITLKVERLLELGAKKVSLPDGSYYWDLKPDWKPREVIEI